MEEIDDADDGSTDTLTVYRDVITLALNGFIAAAILLLPHLNARVEAKQSDSPPGDVIVEATWPPAMDVDVDLWVEAPGDRPVGYSNKGGKIFNLLRDDLGRFADITDINYEVAYSRGIVAGEYAVNIHLYRNGDGTYPVPVTVVASVKSADGQTTKRIALTKLELTRLGEEITAFRFSLDDGGRPQNGSLHNVHKPLRSASR
jgi:hypothetical protein